MKYVKGISLFFVYPACCFLLGMTMGCILYESRGLRTVIEDPVIREQDVSINEQNGEEYEAGGRADTLTDRHDENLPGRYVMNPNALQEMPKTESEGEIEGYFITIADDCVIVYHGDKETIFLTTDIKAEELPTDVQADLESWMYMEDEGMLYDFLENYTS